VTLPPPFLADWPGRFRHPHLCVALASGAVGQATLVDALLRDLALNVDDTEAFTWLLDRGEFPAAEMLIGGSPMLLASADVEHDAQRRLRSQRDKLAAELHSKAEALFDRAQAAGLPAPIDPTSFLPDDAWRYPEQNDRLREVCRKLDGEIKKAAVQRSTQLHRHLSKPLRTAWEERIKRGELLAADRLLIEGTNDRPPPDVVPRPRPWDPTVDAIKVLKGIRSSHRRDWMPGPAGLDLLDAYLVLCENATPETAHAFSHVLAGFLGSAEGRAPVPVSAGYLYRLDLSVAGRLLPLPWLSDVRVLLRTGDEPISPTLAGSDRVIVVDCGRELSPSKRSNLAHLSPGDIVRLSTVTEHQAMQLLRLAGSRWTLRAVGVKDGHALSGLLTGPQETGWGRLAWLLDILDLGGTELTRELTHEVCTHPGAMHILLDVLIRARIRGLKLLLDTRSRLVEAILPPTTPDPAARTAFLAALVADGFDDPLGAEDLAVAVAVEGGNVPDRVLSSGISLLAGHPLVVTTPEGIRLRRCGVLARLRDDAPRMLLDSLAAEHAPGHEDWLAHRWALLPVDAPPDARPDLRADAIRAAEPAAETVDVIHLVETVVADLGAAYPAVDMELDLPAQAYAAVTDAALRTILAELLQNAVDAVTVANRHRIRIGVYSDPDDVLLDVADDGAGVTLPNPHVAVFRRGRNRGDGTSGRGLPDAEALARAIDAQLVLVDPRGQQLQGAHFQLSLPRRPPA
jgi:hypothetical protein